MTTPPHTSALTAWTKWQKSRYTRVTGPQGDLALVETRWTGTEAVSHSAALVGQPASVTVTSLSRSDLTTGAEERGIRLWDSNSPAIRAFDHIDVFEYNPSWIIEATFTPTTEPRTIPFEHLMDNGATRELVVPGDITFTRDGVDYALSAFDDDGKLLLSFADATNGGLSYGAGRFLVVARTNDPTRVVLDFNQAYVPPCGFSGQYNCPLPPRQNRFADEIRAGEKKPVFRNGYTVL